MSYSAYFCLFVCIGLVAGAPEPPSGHQQNAAISAATATVHHQQSGQDFESSGYGAPSVVSSAYGPPQGDHVQASGAHVQTAYGPVEHGQQYEIKGGHGWGGVQGGHGWAGISGWSALFLLIVVPILLLPFFDFIWFAALHWLSKGHGYGHHPGGWGPQGWAAAGPIHGAHGPYGHYFGGHRSLQDKVEDLSQKILPKL